MTTKASSALLLIIEKQHASWELMRHGYRPELMMNTAVFKLNTLE